VSEEIFYRIDLWILFAAFLACLLAAAEIGFLLGRRAQSDVDDRTRSQMNTIQAAVLGMLALLLGFTFSMATSRYEIRKQLVLEESNAIGTTFLRAQLLSEPQRKETSRLLRRYVDIRLEFYRAGIDPVMLRQAADKTEQTHKELWSHAVTLGQKDPRAITTGLFIQSLNEMIDLHSKRMAALENHVPEVVFILLYIVSIIALGMLGYGCGLGGRRSLLMAMTTAFLITLVVVIIMDLDRPRRGLVQVSQKRLIDLQESLRTSFP
jgi:uncharacterized membrane protein